MNQTKLKNSLAKKKAPLPKLKSVLATPFPRYWPKIESEDEESIQELLKAHGKDQETKAYLNCKGIQLGLQSCLRSIKNSSVSSILLSTEIKPAIIISQIINYSLTRDIPINILLVPNLKEITKTIFGIESLALSCLHDKFKNLENLILSKSKNYPIPEKLIQYYGKTTVKEPQLPTETIIKKTDEIINFGKLYILKSNGPFIPENARNLRPMEIDEPKTMFGDYISFSDTNLEKNVSNIKEKNLYDYKTDRDNLIAAIKQHTSSATGDISKDSKINENFKPSSIIQDSSKSEIEQKIERKNDLNPVIKEMVKLNKKKKKKKFPIIYTPLKVHKIQGNPDKKKKNKKNRN